VFGFTVNLEWVRRYYFRELLKQLRVEADGDVAVAVTDERGALVAGLPVRAKGAPLSRRAFAVMFFDPLLVIGSVPSELTRTSWAIETTTADDSQLAAALGGANRLLILSAFASGTLIVGLVLAVRAARAGVELAALRSDFVSSVSHELKTPLATIRAAGDVLAAGSVQDEDERRNYARLMVQEAKRLNRLVDNLLAVSRVADVATVYSFEPFAIDVLVETVLQRLHVQLTSAGFAVTVDVSPDLPPILADRDAILLLLENLLDNAIRYSGDVRRLDIIGRVAEGKVLLDLRDRGRGIPDGEIEQVTNRFYRARNAGSTGTGLGLAIAKRIATDHGGTLRIHSILGVETTITLVLPPCSHDGPSKGVATL
jgi:signal transduction histidine kinase